MESSARREAERTSIEVAGLSPAKVLSEVEAGRAQPKSTACAGDIVAWEEQADTVVGLQLGVAMEDCITTSAWHKSKGADAVEMEKELVVVAGSRSRLASGQPEVAVW